MTHLKIKNKKASGFTLIELMIVVAIVGILSSIAYPSYTKYVQKSKRTEAMVALMQAAQQQEKFFSQNLRYAPSATALGVNTSTENGLYTISITGKKSDGTTCDNTTANACISFTLKATALASQLHDTDCREFTLKNTGEKKSKGVDSSGTLNSANNASGTCW
ncbi:MAG TPA: type IV pilin protein [Thiothrix sp.]|nr:type IV pilin protein [Thiothrix sp.]